MAAAALATERVVHHVGDSPGLQGAGEEDHALIGAGARGRTVGKTQPRIVSERDDGCEGYDEAPDE